MRKAVFIVAFILIAFAGVVGKRYNDWVFYSESPFDEVGIGLHGYMPVFIQDWGCGKLFDRFGGKTLPPYGCQSAIEPQKWKNQG